MTSIFTAKMQRNMYSYNKYRAAYYVVPRSRHRMVIVQVEELPFVHELYHFWFSIGYAELIQME